MKNTSITDILGVKYPIIMAPMFLVTNTDMVISALNSGITAAIPALNYRNDDDFRTAIDLVRSKSDKPFGVNLIVNKSNLKFKAQLNTCIEKKIDFIITSLGNPKETIDRCLPLGIKVFCDVVDLKYAKKVEALGADAIIAVNSEAGGHSGNKSFKELIPQLIGECNIPIISAGGVATKKQLQNILDMGVAGVSIGTIFIATDESKVSEEYKDALVNYGAKDIVRTSNLSGSPLTVINTPYLREIGTKPSFIQTILLNNKWLKKYVKILVAIRGMKTIKKATFGKATYKSIWVAGPSIEGINKIKSVKAVVKSLMD